MSDLIREKIGMALGEASMCWSEIPSGVFDSTRAVGICNKLYDSLAAELEQCRKERDERPTVWAYEQVCKANEDKRLKLDLALKAIDKYLEYFSAVEDGEYPRHVNTFEMILADNFRQVLQKIGGE